MRVLFADDSNRFYFFFWRSPNFVFNEIPLATAIITIHITVYKTAATGLCFIKFYRAALRERQSVKVPFRIYFVFLFFRRLLEILRYKLRVGARDFVKLLSERIKRARRINPWNV